METRDTPIPTNELAQKSKTKKVVLFSLGTLALGTLVFFGIKFYKNHKKENANDSNNQNTDDLDTEKTFQNSVHTKSDTRVLPNNVSDSFPLRNGSKGNKVRLLQQALITTYGAKILPRYGADGSYGRELDSALRSKGYAVPLQEADFQKITGEKEKQTTTPTPPPLLTFDPSAIAKGIYFAITTKDFNSAITLLKSIRNTTNYSLVSEQLKTYQINGVRQTLVNAMLSTFNERTQKLKVQDTFKSMGLKYDGRKWSL